MTGTPILCPSATPWDDPDETFAYPIPHTTQFVKYADFPPTELSVSHIKKTIADYCQSAKWAMEAGFDGVEVHGGNGYLVEQFLASNINKRRDEYGGSSERRCAFVLELMEAVAGAVGEENLAIRLTPFGVFNWVRCRERVETWTMLCRMLKGRLPRLSYVSFVEPVCCRFFYLMFEYH